MISNHTNTRNHLLSALPEEELAEFKPSLTLVSLALKQIIHERDTPIDHVYFIEQGVTSVLTVMSNGVMSEVGMIGAEGVVGMSALLGAEASAQRIIVQVPGSALRMNAALCKECFDQRPVFHRIVLRFVDAFLSHRGRIRITDRDGLATAACECYRLGGSGSGRSARPERDAVSAS